MEDSVQIRIDRPRRLRFTQRSKFRLSKMGLSSADFTTPERFLASICSLVVALIDEPNVTLTPEDVAMAIEGREEEVAEAVKKIMDGIKPAEDDDPGKDGPPDGPSHESNSESAPQNSGG